MLVPQVSDLHSFQPNQGRFPFSVKPKFGAHKNSVQRSFHGVQLQSNGQKSLHSHPFFLFNHSASSAFSIQCQQYPISRNRRHGFNQQQRHGIGSAAPPVRRTGDEESIDDDDGRSEREAETDKDDERSEREEEKDDDDDGAEREENILYETTPELIGSWLF